MTTDTTLLNHYLSVTTNTSLECNQEGDVLIRTIIQLDKKDDYLETYVSVRDLVDSLLEYYREVGHSDEVRSLAMPVLGGIASEFDAVATVLYDAMDDLKGHSDEEMDE